MPHFTFLSVWTCKWTLNLLILKLVLTLLKSPWKKTYRFNFSCWTQTQLTYRADVSSCTGQRFAICEHLYQSLRKHWKNESKIERKGLVPDHQRNTVTLKTINIHFADMKQFLERFNSWYLWTLNFIFCFVTVVQLLGTWSFIPHLIIQCSLSLSSRELPVNYFPYILQQWSLKPIWIKRSHSVMCWQR